MSHTIALPVARRRANPFFGVFRAIVLSLLALFAHGASADPAAAEQRLRIAKYEFNELNLQYTIAKMQLQGGQSGAASVSFTRAQIQAQQMLVSLMKLREDHQHTLDNGLYVNAQAQQEAIDHTEIAKAIVQQLQLQLRILSIQPTSQVDVVRADITLQQLTTRLTRLEYAMIAAQQ